MLYSAFMFSAAALFALVLDGVSALSLSRRANSTMSDTFEDDETCDDYWPAQPECDIAQKKRGDLRVQNSARPFFVKFHKVGGTTLMELLNTFMGVNTNCGRSCGECLCKGEATACTGHISRVVLQHLVKTELSLASNDTRSFLASTDAPLDAQLTTQAERRQLFANVDPQIKAGKTLPLQWLPQINAAESNLVFITLLRNPVERIRSKYYFTRGLKHLQNHDESHHMSFEMWMDTMRHDPETCCEYVQGFGVGSLATSKKVLASLFDVIGFTEEMDEVYAELAGHFGVSKCSLPPQISCRDDSTHKEDWTPEQLSLAKEIASDDIELYNFARDLKKKRLEANTSATVEEEKCPTSKKWGLGWLMR